MQDGLGPMLRREMTLAMRARNEVGKCLLGAHQALGSSPSTTSKWVLGFMSAVLALRRGRSSDEKFKAILRIEGLKLD